MSWRRRPGSEDGTGADGSPLGDLLPPLDGRPGPARLLTPTRRAAMVKAVVDAALADPASSAERAPARTSWSRVLAFAAAALFCFSAAIAPAMVRHLRQALRRPPAEPAPYPWPEPRQEVPSRTTPVPAPALPPPAAERPRAASPAPPAPLARSTPIAGAPRVSLALAPEVNVEEAPLEDLLSLANERLRAHDWSRADQLYSAVSRRFPRSDAAAVALIASATLHLEHLGDPAGALRAYEAALTERPAGALAQEARWGICEAQRKLGDAAAELDALGSFLDHHPDSALAPAARQRRAELRQRQSPDSRRSRVARPRDH